MNGSSINEKLLDILAGFIDINKNNIAGKEDTILEIDSLMSLEIAEVIENEFDISINYEEIESMETFNKMVEVINRKSNQ